MTNFLHFKKAGFLLLVPHFRSQQCKQTLSTVRFITQQVTIQIHTMSFQNDTDLQAVPMGAPEIHPSVTSYAMPASIWKSLYHGDGWEFRNHLDISVIPKKCRQPSIPAGFLQNRPTACFQSFWVTLRPTTYWGTSRGCG